MPVLVRLLSGQSMKPRLASMAPARLLACVCSRVTCGSPPSTIGDTTVEGANAMSCGMAPATRGDDDTAGADWYDGLAPIGPPFTVAVVWLGLVGSSVTDDGLGAAQAETPLHSATSAPIAPARVRRRATETPICRVVSVPFICNCSPVPTVPGCPVVRRNR